MSSVRLVRRDCAGYVPGARGEGRRTQLCGRCGKNRSMHRRWRVIEGGKNKEEGAMAAMSEANAVAVEDRLRGIAAAGEALQIAGQSTGAIVIYMTVTNPVQWEALKTLAGPQTPVRLIGSMWRVGEAIEFYRGDVSIHASGPSWEPSMADFDRMIAQKGEG